MKWKVVEYKLDQYSKYALTGTSIRYRVAKACSMKLPKCEVASVELGWPLETRVVSCFKHEHQARFDAYIRNRSQKTISEIHES